MIWFESKLNKLIKYDIIKLLLDNKDYMYIKDENGCDILGIIKKTIGMDYDKETCENSNIYSLIFNYKNLENLHLCEFDINFIY